MQANISIELSTPTPAFSGHATRADDLETDTEIEGLEEADSLNETIMAIDMRGTGTIGCAYYIARQEKLCLMEDIKLAKLDIVDTLTLHVQPTVILISNRADQALEEHLRHDARTIDRVDGTSEFFCGVSTSVC